MFLVKLLSVKSSVLTSPENDTFTKLLEKMPINTLEIGKHIRGAALRAPNSTVTIEREDSVQVKKMQEDLVKYKKNNFFD